MDAETKWPMRSFWVKSVISEESLLDSKPWTTHMSLVLNLVTPTKAHEYAAGLGLIDNMKMCNICGSHMYLCPRVKHKVGFSWVCKRVGCDNIRSVRDNSFLDGSLGRLSLHEYKYK